MFCSWTFNKKINELPERSVSLSINLYNLSYQELHFLSIMKQGTVQSLMIDVYKYINGLLPSIMTDIFYIVSIDCNLRKHKELLVTKRNTETYGTETLRYKASKIWHILPKEIKSSHSLEQFKINIRNKKFETATEHKTKQ